MTLEITFFGGAGDVEHGELGGVQTLFDDKGASSRFLLEIGQRPDYTNDYYGFPYRPKTFQALAIAEFLHLYPEMEGLYRHDYELHRGCMSGPLPLDGIVATHGHFDHVGGLTLVRHDMPVWMHRMTKMILLVWQYTSGRTLNQFVDLVSQFALGPDTQGGKKFMQGDEAVLGRNIQLYHEGEPFRVGNIPVTAYPVDHSLPGACGLIVETSAGKIGISGDIRKRGRRPQDTENFVSALLKQNIDYLMWEGSLLNFEHEGTEEDVAHKVSALIKDRAFAAIAYPPRDLDRVTSLYNAAKSRKRMLVVSPSQALMLKLFDGANGYPRLDGKYIGVLLPPKKRGLIDRDGFENMVQDDYYFWERPFLDYAEWSEADCHRAKPQRVSVEDLKNHQDQFLVYMPLNYMINLMEQIRPQQGSIYIRSHPAPWTPDMDIQEARQINMLKQFGMYDGPQPDHLNPSIQRSMHQVHITGHLNRRETREILRRFSCTVIAYHCEKPTDFISDVASHTKVIVPERGKTLTLG